ncbi:hypothetical protein E2C01_076163 [Portunus trituberculatus]|uniref:Uncharacterized protein n=1 Tax=Portunus trituberculatus TaxID=210409 RepID=A0A5B7I7Z9_PORTR|nr:hypothetical protein [Portunus trituberculatus]
MTLNTDSSDRDQYKTEAVVGEAVAQTDNLKGLAQRARKSLRPISISLPHRSADPPCCGVQGNN